MILLKIGLILYLVGSGWWVIQIGLDTGPILGSGFGSGLVTGFLNSSPVDRNLDQVEDFWKQLYFPLVIGFNLKRSLERAPSDLIDHSCE